MVMCMRMLATRLPFGARAICASLPPRIRLSLTCLGEGEGEGECEGEGRARRAGGSA